ncbi:MAG: hypothetical protein KBC58_10905 [Flavobacterium sp.]|nr:hypothetical protein [Flavobacterium sp.]
MKFFTKIVLVIFILFQFSSIIVCVINERNDTKFTFNITEEEEHSKEVKVIKSAFVISKYKLLPLFDEATSLQIQDTYLLKQYAVNPTIFHLPPEQV